MEWDSIIAIFIGFSGGAVSAYITVKVTVAELRKDIIHVREKLDDEIQSKSEKELSNSKYRTEVRDDVKAIFRTLTKIQVDVAKTEAREDVLNVVREAIDAVNKKK